MLCGGLSMCDFAHVSYPCSIVYNTFGIWTPSFPIIFLVFKYCYAAHPSIYCCRIYDLPWTICHPAPPIIAQPCGRSNPSPLVVSLAQEISRQKWRFKWANVSSKPTNAGWATSSPRHAHAWISTHNSNHGVWHAIIEETSSTNTNPHVAHVVVCGPRPLQCDGHTMEASRPACLQMSGLDAWISLGKDVHCC